MNHQEALDTLKDIRKIMEKSTRFLSLDGMSAVVVGLYACLGAVVAYYILGGIFPDWTGGFAVPQLQINTPARLRLLLVFAVILVGICMITVIFMSRRKALKEGPSFGFDRTARRLLWHFFLPLIAGGVLCLSLIHQQHYGLTSSIMLIFYGIALIHASHYTYSNTRYLGYAEVLLGLADSFVEGYALLFWTIGFGLFHIIYGLWFYRKFEKRPVSVTVSDL